ncbi:MAG: hypothetical protein ACYDDN_08195 [Candidatus Desulforudaceae bacterium]
MDDIISRLDELAAKFKQNKKLSNADNKIGRDKLRILLLSPDYADRALLLLVSLPNPCCGAFADAWTESDTNNQERIVSLLLQSPAPEMNPGWVRRISIISAFIPVDTHSALDLLVDLCRRLTLDGSKVPPKPVVGRFWKELMSTKKLLKISLGDREVGIPEISGVAGMVLLGMLENREGDVPLKARFVEWLAHCRTRAILGASLVTEAEKVTKKWPEELQRACQAVELIKTVSFCTAPQGAKDLESPPSVVITNSEKDNPVQEKQGGAYNFPKDLTLERCLRWLQQHGTVLETENAELKRKTQALNTNYQREKDRNAEQARQKDILQGETKRQESLISGLSESIESLKQQREELMSDISKERHAQRQEVEELKERIDKECSYVVDEIRNKLQDKLSRYYNQYREASVRTSNGELAEHYKYLCDRVFRELTNQGIRFGGAE